MSRVGGTSGEGGVGPRAVYVAVAVVLTAAVLIAVGTTVALLRSREAPTAEAAATSTSSSTTSTSARRSGSATETAPATVVAPARGAVCDAEVIASDLGYPGSGGRIIDCGGGWAVMASEFSGDPYWVTFRGGRWTSADGVSMYTGTCPDEAIALGAPAWMAREHLGTCRTTMRATPSTGTRARTPRSPSSSGSSVAPRQPAATSRLPSSPSVPPTPTAAPTAAPSASQATGGDAESTEEGAG